MIIIEASIIISLVTGIYIIKVVGKKLGYRLSKKKLKKLLLLGFETMDTDIIKSSIKALSDFDSKNSTHKLDKYLLEIIKVFRDDEEKPTLNEKNVLNLAKEFIFDNIFDDDEKEEERQLDVIDEKIEESRKVLEEVDKRRKEIILRKNEIRQKQITKSSKRRKSGKMG